MIPQVSIIIPTLNRAQSLKRAIESVFANEFKNFELIIVDNGSIDFTKSVCEVFNTKANFIYIYDETPGLIVGRHLGFSKSNAPIVCFLDDDVEISAKYIKNVIETFSDETIQLATGPCLPKYEVKPLPWLNYMWDQTNEGHFCAWLSLLDFGNQTHIIHPNFVWGLNFCIRKEALIALDGFHPDSMPKLLQKFQGDGETGLTSKAALRNYNAVYSPGLFLYHHINKERCTLEYFKNRAYFQGVCNSFTDLRAKILVEPLKESPIISVIKKVRNAISRYCKWLKNTKQKEIKSLPNEINLILSDLKNAEMEGYNFHQEAFKNDPLVKEWVLRKNYWTFKLPK